MNWRNLLKVCSGLALSASLVYFIVATLHWPLVNDAALMHYVIFVMDHGMAPYRDIGDMELPGTYLVEWIAMHALGGGALAWRLFDLLLLAAGGAAMISIAKPYTGFGGFYAAALFALFHGRDGAGQLGQRDLTIAVTLLIACAFLFAAVRRKRPLLTFPVGLLSGLAISIKPTALLFFAFLLVLAACALNRKRKLLWSYGIYALVGLAVPFAAMLISLIREHALSAFLDVVRGELAYHTTVGNRGLPYLLKWSLTPSVLTLAMLAIIIAVLRQSWREWEMAAISGCAVLGWICFLLQRKGFPYHRYPMLAFLFLWVGIEFSKAIEEPFSKVFRYSAFIRPVACAGVVYGSIALAPLYALRAKKSHWNETMLRSLQSDLTRLGGGQLSGRVQCVDSVSGCLNALYDMGLMQSTNTLYDEFLFGPINNPIIKRDRDRFLGAIQRQPPEVFIVTDSLFPSGPDHYEKLKMWPGFENYLAANYRMIKESSFLPGETGRLGYRIYVADGDAGNKKESRQ